MDADPSSVRKDRALCGHYAHHVRLTHPGAEWAEVEPSLHRMWMQQPHAMRWDVARVVMRFIWALAPILPDGDAPRTDSTGDRTRH